jgi:hypothetical protein
LFYGEAQKWSNSDYETDFGVSSACDAGNTKIGFLKVRLRRTFKKPIFIMRIVSKNGNVAKRRSHFWVLDSIVMFAVYMQH